MKTVDEFHKLYYGERFNEIYRRTFYMGVPCLKCPLDLWIYQEIFWEYKPDYIVDLGTFSGGSALQMAHTVSNLGLKTKILSVDISFGDSPKHPKIQYLTGSSTDPSMVAKIESKIGDGKVIVILDSLHTRDHVLQELILYSPLVKLGGYLIVEDCNLNGHPVRPDWGPGPYEATQEFLANHSEFIRDISREKFLMTFNPGGYLKRIG